MPGAWWSKAGLVVAIIVVAALALVPTLYPVPEENRDRPEDSWPGWVSSIHEMTGGAKVTLGLDLQDGLHLQYQVDVDKAISDKVDQFTAQIAREVRRGLAEGAEFTVERVPDTPAIRVVTPGHNPLDLISDDTLFAMNLNPISEGTDGVRLEIDSGYIEETKQYAIEQAIATIDARVNATGVAEPSISRRGTTDIIVQLPGLAESEFDRMKDLIAQTAQLEFHMVSEQDAAFFGALPAPPASEEWSVAAGRPQANVVGTEPDAQAQALVRLRQHFETIEPPVGAIVAYQEVTQMDASIGEFRVTAYQPILLDAETELTGEYITDARTGTDARTNQPVVNITFDGEGTRVFGQLTTDNVNRLMAIVLDDVVNSAPRINEPILGGRCQITLGGNSYQESMLEAQGLAIVLRNGALPAPIEKQFETQVGPSLGADSIRAGELSLAVAFLLVFVFICAYYKLSGAIASVALLLNMLFILACLALLGATLTLPGIAGIVLTIGMAVDANVIVFERIKEELALGKSARAAIHAGYEKALSAVLDANITTGIAGLVLMEFGSGPVRGFAVTLIIGIICSLFTALFVTRLIFDYLLDGAKISRVSI